MFNSPLKIFFSDSGEIAFDTVVCICYSAFAYFPKMQDFFYYRGNNEEDADDREKAGAGRTASS